MEVQKHKEDVMKIVNALTNTNVKALFTRTAMAVVVAGAALMATPTKANAQVSFRIRVGRPYYAPAPIYVAPRPIYVPPVRVYAPGVYVAPGYGFPGGYYDRRADFYRHHDWDRRRDWDRR
jgi:hypothetical protein